MQPLRRTKILCTIGPSCDDEKTLANLAEGGMNIARLNFSHGTREGHEKTIAHVRSASAKTGIPIGIMLDTKGAEIRTGVVKNPIPINAGDEVVFTSNLERAASEKRTSVSIIYERFAQDARETDKVLIDNGELSLKILSIDEDGSVITRALGDGHIGSNRHVNLPGAYIDLPTVTEKDWEDIAFAVEQELDFVAISFVREAEDVTAVRSFLEEKSSSMQIIAKIETVSAVENIGEILKVSDGIMVARGDLGADMPFEDLPVVQEEIVTRCRDVGKPVIIATHMLESMSEHPVPTRAEVTDTAFAVLIGSDATMLSVETAAGEHPRAALDAMVRIHLATEHRMERFTQLHGTAIHGKGEEHADRAVEVAEKEEANAILVLSKTGNAAKRLSKFRPEMPILTVVPDGATARSLLLYYGVIPIVQDGEPSASDTVAAAKKARLMEDGMTVVLVSDGQEEVECLGV